ncbi:ATP-binding protein [Caedibacter taeniospiralis]|uniref:ATP-binding protein n=1 Tax=Caedibacter taeniospiralis TaxID=28907 RepID=UPI000C26E20C|nr:ATP-binding protein [Caedibacter taeniospiralis]
MYKRLLAIDTKMTSSVFLFGPRGTGKTHWLKNTFPSALYFDLLDDAIYTEFLGDAKALSRKIPKTYEDWIIIDEVQKIPSLLNEVHRLIEHQKCRFVLTGSSARALRKKGVNLLAGRALTYHMHPLTASELQDDFDLAFSLKYGNLPMVYSADNPEHFLKSYIQTYLKEEVQQEALTRNLAVFTKFLQTASFSQGETINYSNIAREIGSNHQSVRNFFDILEDLLIAYRLPVFTRRAKREVVTQTKFYYFDAGVYRAIRPKGPLDSEEELSGAALESLFFQQAKALNDYYFLGYEFYYWRTQAKHEVDFILYGERGLYAIEIKRKSKLIPHDFKGLRLFQEDYPMAKCIMLYGGDQSYWENEINVMPFENAIRTLDKILTGTLI